MGTLATAERAQSTRRIEFSLTQQERNVSELRAISSPLALEYMNEVSEAPHVSWRVSPQELRNGGPVGMVC